LNCSSLRENAEEIVASRPEVEVRNGVVLEYDEHRNLEIEHAQLKTIVH